MIELTKRCVDSALLVNAMKVIDGLQASKNGKFILTKEYKLRSQNLLLNPVNLPRGLKTGMELEVEYEGADQPCSEKSEWLFSNISGPGISWNDSCIIIKKIKDSTNLNKSKGSLTFYYTHSVDRCFGEYCPGAHSVMDTKFQIKVRNINYGDVQLFYREGFNICDERNEKDQRRMRFFNEEGILLPTDHYFLVWHFLNGFARVSPDNNAKVWSFINKSGKEIASGFQNANDFNFGLAAVKLNGKWGVINENGKQVIKPSFDSAGVFGECKLINVLIDKKYGFANKKGKLEIEPRFDNTLPFSDDLAAVKIRSKWGFIDKEGIEKIHVQYDSVKSFSEGYAAVKMDSMWGFIDRDGKVKIELKYSAVTSFKNGYAYVFIRKNKSEIGIGFIDRSGQLVNDLISSARESYGHFFTPFYEDGFFFVYNHYWVYASKDGVHCTRIGRY